MDKSDQSFTYYDVGEFLNAHKVPINALPVRRKTGTVMSNPKLQGGKPFDQMIVQFWYKGKWVLLNRSNAYLLYGHKPRN